MAHWHFFSQLETILPLFSDTSHILYCHQTRLLGSKYHIHAFAAGALPQTPLGSLHQFHRSYSWLGRGGTEGKGESNGEGREREECGGE